MNELKEKLDNLINKQRVAMYKPIQIAEILYRTRLGELNYENLVDPIHYRNPSKRWRDEVSRQLIGRTSTSSQKFQDNLFDDNAIPPTTLKDLDVINRKNNGVVERYIYQHFSAKQRTIQHIREYLDENPDVFNVSDFLDRFRLSAGLKRSIDKAYEITVYALMNAILKELRVIVEVSLDTNELQRLREFTELLRLLLGISPDSPKRVVEARLFRAGVANAADKGIDIWANFGPIIQVKHVSLTEDKAEDISEDTTADEIIIVCRDIDADVVKRISEQLGQRIKGVIQESHLIEWYNVGFRADTRDSLGHKILQNLKQEFDHEFPSSNAFQDFYEERGYDKIPQPSDECPFWQPDVY